MLHSKHIPRTLCLLLLILLPTTATPFKKEEWESFFSNREDNNFFSQYKPKKNKTITMVTYNKFKYKGKQTEYYDPPKKESQITNFQGDILAKRTEIQLRIGSNIFFFSTEEKLENFANSSSKKWYYNTLAVESSDSIITNTSPTHTYKISCALITQNREDQSVKTYPFQKVWIRPHGKLNSLTTKASLQQEDHFHFINHPNDYTYTYPLTILATKEISYAELLQTSTSYIQHAARWGLYLGIPLTFLGSTLSFFKKNLAPPNKKTKNSPSSQTPPTQNKLTSQEKSDPKGVYYAKTLAYATLLTLSMWFFLPTIANKKRYFNPTITYSLLLLRQVIVSLLAFGTQFLATKYHLRRSIHNLLLIIPLLLSPLVYRNKLLFFVDTLGTLASLLLLETAHLFLTSPKTTTPLKPPYLKYATYGSAIATLLALFASYRILYPFNFFDNDFPLADLKDFFLTQQQWAPFLLLFLAGGALGALTAVLHFSPKIKKSTLKKYFPSTTLTFYASFIPLASLILYLANYGPRTISLLIFATLFSSFLLHYAYNKWQYLITSTLSLLKETKTYLKTNSFFALLKKATTQPPKEKNPNQPTQLPTLKQKIGHYTKTFIYATLLTLPMWLFLPTITNKQNEPMAKIAYPVLLLRQAIVSLLALASHFLATKYHLRRSIHNLLLIIPLLLFPLAYSDTTLYLADTLGTLAACLLLETTRLCLRTPKNIFSLPLIKRISIPLSLSLTTSLMSQFSWCNPQKRTLAYFMSGLIHYHLPIHLGTLGFFLLLFYAFPYLKTTLQKFFPKKLSPRSIQHILYSLSTLLYFTLSPLAWFLFGISTFSNNKNLPKDYLHPFFKKQGNNTLNTQAALLHIFLPPTLLALTLLFHYAIFILFKKPPKKESTPKNKRHTR